MIDRAEFTLRLADGAELALGRRTLVMGILNVTPDSFSDGGLHERPAQAIAAAERMIADGADLIDVGGESTRPGAAELDAESEIHRVLPVIETLRKRSAVRISVDTKKAAVARRALDVGADIVNDVSALSDPAMPALLAERGAPVVLMHMRGTPATMQQDTHYDDLCSDVVKFLGDRAGTARAAGVADDRIIADPGIGFGKSAEGSLALVRSLSALQRLGLPILVGASRKSFIGAKTDLGVDDRLEASLAIAAYAAAEGAHIVRVHDVGPTRRAVDIIDAMHQI